MLLDHEDYTPASLTPVAPDGPDAWAENMTLRVLDSNGKTAYKITAEHMVHYPETDRLELTKPLINITRQDGTVWQISAERGKSTASGDLVWLRGAVDIERQFGNVHGSLHIAASDVLVKPAEKMAETENIVLISTDSYRFEAIGLKADFRTNHLELHSSVRGKINGAG
jgi:lipopolysaccharide export system protein LptC